MHEAILLSYLPCFKSIKYRLASQLQPAPTRIAAVSRITGDTERRNLPQTRSGLRVNPLARFLIIRFNILAEYV